MLSEAELVQRALDNISPDVLAGDHVTTWDIVKESMRVFLNALAEHNRAQADARPVEKMLKLAHDAFSDYLDTGGGSPVAQARFMNRMREFNAAYTAPPAESAGVGLSDANAIIAKHFANDPANAVRAHAAVIEILSRTHAADGEAPRNWPEDASHENGNYECRCCTCGNLFVGHKRRVTCKVCATAPQAAHQQAEPKRCEYCDGTGDVTRADGEWLGECTVCKAAEQQAEPAEDEVSRLHTEMAGLRLALDQANRRADNAVSLSNHLQDQLAAQSGQRAGVAEGFKVVPIEPTEAMFDAARSYWFSLHKNAGAWPCGEAMGIYAAMIAAAPTQQEGGS